ncbi:hypothetical protein FALBO_5256 [Fusarium albosuccineum]|uniref:Uncharacterized protein n=1 Tax=Fusarium albosuccineum TaxID=1237068 RepID=A0A8H4LH38_9HYPO|nr:hypothetical protein FALBO_5256 [Fusarium albosuccineum]
MDANKPSSRAACSIGTQMLGRLIYDTSSIQDRLIQGPISTPTACSAAVTTVAAISSVFPEAEKGTKKNLDRNREEILQGSKI